MSNDGQPTINDLLDRLYVIRDTTADSVREEARALLAHNSAKGMLQSGKTLKELVKLIEAALDKAQAEVLMVLRHIQAVPGIDRQACRDQAFLRTRDLLPVLRDAAQLDDRLKSVGSVMARDEINKRLARLDERIAYQFRQFDVGLDRVGLASGATMTPTATRLQQRLSERMSWFRNQWFFKWHHIGGSQPIEIDLFDGRFTSLGGLKFWGSPREVYWDAVSRGLCKEVLDQFSWVEEAAKGYERSVAIQAINESADLLASFADAIRRAAVEKDRILRGDGVNFPSEEDRGHWAGTRAQDIRDQADALKAALFPSSSSSAFLLQTVATPVRTIEADSRRFQVALSFAGEQRDYVRDVASALAARHIAVFYDEFQSNALWGTDGAEHFHRIYSRDTQFVVMFISAEYVSKAWTRHERRSAISRQMKEVGEYILPVRFDQTEVDGLPDTIQYLSAKNFTPAELAVEIAKKVGVNPNDGKASHVPPPSSSAMSGEVTFDYGAYNGRYVIGSGASAFETAWSKGSNTAIRLYNDPVGIHGIALARGATAIEDIVDAASYDFTSRSRTVKIGEIAVLRNTDGFYAAVQVLEIADDSRGALSDALTIRYIILPSGKTTFSVEQLS